MSRDLSITIKYAKKNFNTLRMWERQEHEGLVKTSLFFYSYSVVLRIDKTRRVIYLKRNGEVAQMGERRLRKAEVRSSILPFSTNNFNMLGGGVKPPPFWHIIYCAHPQCHHGDVLSQDFHKQHRKSYTSAHIISCVAFIREAGLQLLIKAGSSASNSLNRKITTFSPVKCHDNKSYLVSRTQYLCHQPSGR